MKEFYNYNIIRRTIIQFLDMFNYIMVARYDETTGDVIKYVKVPLKFAPKTRQWYFLEKRDAEGRRIRDKIFPIMSVNLTGMEYDAERQGNKQFIIYKDRSIDAIEYFANPKPYTFPFEVKIAAEYMVDITQVLEQILPFFNPAAQIRITVPELNIGDESDNTDYGAPSLDLKVLYDGATPNTPIDIDEANYRVLEWTLNFKVNGWLFTPLQTTVPVKKISTKFYTTADGWSYYADTTTENICGVGHDSEELFVYGSQYVSAGDGSYTKLWDYEIYGPDTDDDDLDVLYYLQMEDTADIRYYLWEDDKYIALE